MKQHSQGRPFAQKVAIVIIPLIMLFAYTQIPETLIAWFIIIICSIVEALIILNGKPLPTLVIALDQQTASKLKQDGNFNAFIRSYETEGQPEIQAIVLDIRHNERIVTIHFPQSYIDYMQAGEALSLLLSGKMAIKYHTINRANNEYLVQEVFNIDEEYPENLHVKHAMS